MLGIYRVAAQLVTPRAVLSSTELVNYDKCNIFLLKMSCSEHFEKIEVRYIL
jgi:hypothetical protein